MWEERISVVRAFADAITERDVEAALELCHPEIEFFSLLAQLEASPYRGFAGITQRTGPRVRGPVRRSVGVEG